MEKAVLKRIRRFSQKIKIHLYVLKASDYMCPLMNLTFQPFAVFSSVILALARTELASIHQANAFEA